MTMEPIIFLELNHGFSTKLLYVWQEGLRLFGLDEEELTDAEGRIWLRRQGGLLKGLDQWMEWKNSHAWFWRMIVDYV